jgi:hypothetical protein
MCKPVGHESSDLNVEPDRLSGRKERVEKLET